MTVTCEIHQEIFRWHYVVGNVKFNLMSELEEVPTEKADIQKMEYMCPSCRYILYRALGFTIEVNQH